MPAAHKCAPASAFSNDTAGGAGFPAKQQGGAAVKKGLRRMYLAFLSPVVIAFLIAYMPERDLQQLTAAFLLGNADYAYQARDKYSWAKALPDSIFLNEVLPYVSLNETREGWRKDFYERFGKYVAHCNTIFEAIDSINRNIRDEVMVDYNTKR